MTIDLEKSGSIKENMYRNEMIRFYFGNHQTRTVTINKSFDV